MCFLRALSWQFESYLETYKLSNKFVPVVSCVAVAMCYCGHREVWSVLLISDSLTWVRRQFVTTPSRLFASGHSFIMSNQEFVDQRLTGRDLWHVAGPCFLLRRFTHLVSTYQLQSCHMALGVLFSVSNLFIKKTVAYCYSFSLQCINPIGCPTFWNYQIYSGWQW